MLCVGVDVATNASASDIRATCVKMGGIVTCTILLFQRFQLYMKIKTRLCRET